MLDVLYKDGEYIGRPAWWLILLSKRDAEAFWQPFLGFGVPEPWNSGKPTFGVTASGEPCVLITTDISSPILLPQYNSNFNELWKPKDNEI